MIRRKVSETDVGKRLDIYAHELLPEVSRGFIQRLAGQGRIRVNGSVEKISYRLRVGEKIEIDYKVEELHNVPDIRLPIIYEDDDCLVINKPVGVLTHSKGAFNPESTVATFIRDKLKDMSGDRGGIVHRLDRATSGVIICAKHSEAVSWLQKQFSSRKVKKTYLAVVSGHLSPEAAVIDMPIERNPRKPQTFRVGSNGKPARTEYKVIKRGEQHDLVELRPTTGRTHQLRVHMRQLGHPIVGDVLYGKEPAERLFLHAKEIEITLPNRERVRFVAPTPKNFSRKVNS